MKKSEFLEKLHLSVSLYDQFCIDKYEELQLKKIKKSDLAGEAAQSIGILPNTPNFVFDENPIVVATIMISRLELQYSIPLTMSKLESAWEYFTLQK